MSDRYLFKAKRTDNREWVKGYLWTGSSHAYITPDNVGIYYDEKEQRIKAFAHEIDKSTICQYTGLTDKNGKKIWENDIVSFIDMYSTENGYVEMDCVGQVKWCEEELCFYVTERLSAESWEVLQECMVIGNIFDDPELLKGGTE